MKNKVLLLLSSVVCAMPAFVGILLWDEPMAVFGLAALMILIQWLCVWATSKDPRRKQVSDKVYGLVYWICPLVSVFASVLMYGTVFQMPVDVNVIGNALIGCIFCVIGNYLPKCRQNYTIGIRVPWTLDDEENWYHTHRFGGYAFALEGVLAFFNIFLHSSYVLMVMILVAAISPVVYSYVYYVNHKTSD